MAALLALLLATLPAAHPPSFSLCIEPDDVSIAHTVECELLPAPDESSRAETEGRFEALAREHRLSGNACYYASRFEGRKTANGEIFRQSLLTAAHLTLPLGSVVDVESIATGRSVRVRVNDRGPYSGGFVIDLSRAAARAIGVDVAADRSVQIRLVEVPERGKPQSPRGSRMGRQ